MQALIAFALLVSQLSGVRSYTLPNDDGMVIVTPTGRFSLELGAGCDDLNIAENVDVFAGSGGVATIAPPNTDMQCTVFVGPSVSDVPCFTDDAGLCSLDAEMAP